MHLHKNTIKINKDPLQSNHGECVCGGEKNRVDEKGIAKKKLIIINRDKKTYLLCVYLS